MIIVDGGSVVDRGVDDGGGVIGGSVHHTSSAISASGGGGVDRGVNKAGRSIVSGVTVAVGIDSAVSSVSVSSVSVAIAGVVSMVDRGGVVDGGVHHGCGVSVVDGSVGDGGGGGDGEGGSRSEGDVGGGGC